MAPTHYHTSAVHIPRNSSPRRLLVLVHGTRQSIEWIRATRHIGIQADAFTQILPRESGAWATFRSWASACRTFRPDLAYVINTANPGIPFALWTKLHKQLPFILDTGDLVFEMARRSGVEPLWKWPVLWAGESAAHRACRTLVVRSACYQDHLRARGFHHVQVLRDGFDPCMKLATESEVAALRWMLGLQGQIVIGLLGSLVWSPRLKLCYGWDLIRALDQLRDLPMMGLIVGDGSGRTWLEQQARKLGLTSKIRFVGRVQYDDLNRYLRLFDIALSTQTNNLPGQVRTTGKIPEYLAAGRFILASKVGEAARVLPAEMLVDYHGEVDDSYPGRLAERLRAFAANPNPARELASRNRELADRYFGQAVLRARFDQIVRRS